MLSASPSPPLTILVVENHPDTLKYMRLYLESRGHRVESAGTVNGALEKLAATPCDVLVCDIGLPDGTGWELLERAKLPASTYAIAMSGYGTGRDQSRSKAAGFRHHLIKPFSPEQLGEILADVQRERERE